MGKVIRLLFVLTFAGCCLQAQGGTQNATDVQVEAEQIADKPVVIVQRSSLPPTMHVSHSTIRRIARNAGDYESIRSERGPRLQAKMASSNGSALWIRGASGGSNGSTGQLYLRAGSASNGSGVYVHSPDRSRSGGSTGGVTIVKEASGQESLGDLIERQRKEIQEISRRLTNEENEWLRAHLKFYPDEIQ